MTRRYRADLHVHSRYSDASGSAGIRALRSTESFTDPVELYHAQRARGMDFVTVTDHNTLGGSLAIAHLPGANQSLWRSDITFLNDTDSLISARVDYVPEESLGYSPFMIMNIDPGNALYYVDILGVSMLPPETDSKGYFVVTSRGDYAVPHMVARTYNVATEGGTFGQNLVVFDEGDLIHEGESGFIPGVGNSPSQDQGFRTNVGVLNTDTENGATVSVTLYDTAGGIAAHLSSYWIPPAKFVQYNIFQALGIGDQELHASIEVHVVSGGPIAVYASEIDNRTQDPILVPAVTPQSMQR